MSDAAEAAPPAKVMLTVVNGDLSFSPFPVLVGHFAGDAMSSSETQLDAALDQALSTRYALGVYPAQLGSATVEPHPDGDRAPGVIVGLGDMADFNAGAIRRATIAGLLELALSPLGRKGNPGVSLVLLGAHACSISASDTLLAMLGALEEVQRRLVDRKLRRFEAIQFVSQMEDEAHLIWHALRRMTATPPFSDSFDLDGEIRYAAGAARRVSPLENRDNWRAIQVESKTLPDGSDGFRFAAVGDRARAEGYLVGTNRAFLSSFMTSAIDGQISRLPGSSPARTLFELVWPRDLKQTSHEDRNLRLILDNDAATLPFEIMDDRGETEQDLKPPAVRHGLLRQLVQQNFAPIQFTARGGCSALVIGDPRGGTPAIGFPELDGARQEAVAVADLLEQHGYTVTRLIGDQVTPSQVVQALLRGGWTIIHVAGHGIYEYAFKSDRDAHAADPSKPLPRYTGVVLNEGIVISPGLLQSMPDPPTLAFINCCSLGTIDVADERALREAGRPELAASFAAELIALGSRAVIASGWELDDNPALAFALTFYGDLLGSGGPGYGEAVRHAREVAYDKYPSSTTWGAYQCYGEPDWRLSTEAGAPQSAASVPEFASPAEAIAAIASIDSMASVGAGRDRRRQALLDQLVAIEACIDQRGWQSRPGVPEAIGRAQAALGNQAAAIAQFEAALAADAAPSIRLIETLANLRIRAALDNADKAAALAEIQKARLSLEHLCAIAGETSERLSLLGGAAKREAALAEGADIDLALARMRDAYAAALQIARQNSPNQAYYPAQLVASASVILALRGGDKEPSAAALAAFSEALQTQPEAADDYWLKASRAGHVVLKCLDGGDYGGRTIDQACTALHAAWSLSGTATQFASTTEDLAFTEALIKDAAPEASEWLAAIQAKVQPWSSS